MVKKAKKPQIENSDKEDRDLSDFIVNDDYGSLDDSFCSDDEEEYPMVSMMT